jgi:Fuc2NAc and GlcNAc transferase
MTEFAWLHAATFALSLCLTFAMVTLAKRVGLLDRPNERSSHRVVTPRGGGIAIVGSATLAFVVLWWRDTLSSSLLVALLGGGLSVATVGILDDRRSVSPKVRMAVHLGAAMFAVGILGALPSIQVGEHFVQPGWVGYGLAVLGLAWSLNLFNFMDGIDGIAASEASFVTLAGSVLALGSQPATGWEQAGLALGVASLGFLCLNWPPARIFMGDVGSGYLGFAIAVLALADAHDHPAAIWKWLILGGVFFTDATVTLAKRLARGERASEAHRTHAYQWLSRHWGGHLKVTLTVLAVNACWLLPLAWAASRHSAQAAWLAVVALAPLVVAALLAGAGRPE